MSCFNMYTIVLTLILFINLSNGATPITPCSADDAPCLVSTANSVYQLFLTGAPDLGIEPHEPMYHPLIVGDLAMLQFKLINTTFTGLDKCVIVDFRQDPSALSLQFKVSCGLITMRGLYELDGRLMVMPVHGTGECQVVAEGYDVVIDATYKLEAGRMTIKTYAVQADATKKITFDFQNLFDGQKELSDTVHQYANANWKEVADFVEHPIWYAHIKNLVSTANKFLKTVQFE